MRDATGGLTLSGGLGPNFRLAKVAADQKKPDGQFRVGAGKAAVLSFLRDLPCRKVDSCVEIKFPRHRRDPCSMGGGARLSPLDSVITAASSPRNDMWRISARTHCLISTQVGGIGRVLEMKLSDALNVHLCAEFKSGFE